MNPQHRGVGRKWGVYEKCCDLRGGSMKNKRQYLKGVYKRN